MIRFTKCFDIAPADGLGLDGALLETTAADGRSRAAVWSSAPALIVSRRDERLPTFAAAAAAMEAAGLPVLIRQSGGTAVVQGPGILTISLTYALPPGRGPGAIDTDYGILLEVVGTALAPLGIDLSLGAVPGAFCDGRHNLVMAGRKIAGTAQKRCRRQFQAVLVHAALLVDCDLDRVCTDINRFYELAGGDLRCSADACITVTQASGQTGGPISAALTAAAQAWLENQEPASLR